MTAPTVTVSGINVRISWVAPNSNGADIFEYEVLIKESDGDFSENTAYCDGSDAAIVTRRYCDIPMSILRLSPYSLAYNAVVYAKVSARNTIGWNTASILNTVGA